MIFWEFLLLFIYLEVVYHIAGFGLTAMNPMIMLGFCLFWAGIDAFIISLFRKKAKTAAGWILIVLNIIIYGVQLIYWQVFKQPLLISAFIHAGGDAIVNYWKEILYAIARAWLPTILLFLPILPIILINRKLKEADPKKGWSQRAMYLIGLAAGILLFGAGLLAGKTSAMFSTQMYQEFSAPDAVFEEYGVLASIQRNIHEMIFGSADENDLSELGGLEPGNNKTNGGSLGAFLSDAILQDIELPVIEKPQPNIMPIDFAALLEKGSSKEIQILHKYVENKAPTMKNDYTGMFEGYNLIYMTAEGFAPYCISEEITPTLYKLTHSGFQFENYYVPLWHTSTSDGEFCMCTGLVPDKQFSFRRTIDNAMPFLLPGFFKEDEVDSLAYHNNSLSYYDRYKTHDNMGYFFKAATRGKLNAEKWKDHLFEIEHPKAWPQSDLEMVQATLGDYINQPRFHAYYMTVSGHLQYTFAGNKMAAKNKAFVEELPYSDRAKAYIACNIEFDRALEWLISELDKAGKLENTVICFGADHYPYGLEEEEIEELRGAPLENKYDIYQSSLILWNSAMEPVVVHKPCYSVDVLPTLLNLFGFEYDSRLYCGQDILSDSDPLVIFSDKSFMTDRVYYDARKKEAKSMNGEEVDGAYLEQVKKQVKETMAFSAGILDYDYYRTLLDYAPGAKEE